MKVSYIEKSPEFQTRRLMDAILSNGFYIAVRCPEEGDLIQTPTAQRQKGFDGVFAVDLSLVEAVAIDRDTKKRTSVAAFCCLPCEGDALVVDHSNNETALKIMTDAGLED